MGKIRILGIAIIAALLLGLGGPVAAQGQTPVSINAPDTAVPDSDFTATVDIGEVVDLNAVEYDVSFDSTVLQLDDITPGQIDGTGIPVMFSKVSPGTYRVVQSMGLDKVSGSGYLSVLHFHVIGSLGDSSLIDLSNGLLSGWEGQIPATWTGDSVHVAVDIIAISVEPASVDFGSVTLGVASAPQTVTVTNTGNVAEDFSATLENISTPDVYTTGLTIDAYLVTGWSALDVAVGGNVVPQLILTVPDGTAPGTYTATLVFWAEKGAGN